MLLMSHQKDNAIGEGKTEKSKKKKKKSEIFRHGLISDNYQRQKKAEDIGLSLYHSHDN